jgi:SulP family sulfate permease
MMAHTDGNDISDGDDDVNGAFPLPGKEALAFCMFFFLDRGVMCSFYLISPSIPLVCKWSKTCQVTNSRSFALHQGYGMAALSTLFSCLTRVGLCGYRLSFWEIQMGRAVYYIPSHVLVGCIGGIGPFIAKTG